MKAFYFANEDRTLRYGDGRKIEVGVTHKHEGDVLLCQSGLHAALSPFEALQYAPGPILYLVRLSGTIVKGRDKAAASERTYLAEYDAYELLRLFARKCALKNIELISPYCSAEQYALIVEYLTSGNASVLSAARSAAWAAESAARSAAESAAWAAESAAESAAWGAAESAAWGAAWAAESAARSAAESAAESAAWGAAESAAWGAARSALVEEFNAMIKEATGWEF